VLDYSQLLHWYSKQLSSWPNNVHDVILRAHGMRGHTHKPTDTENKAANCVLQHVQLLKKVHRYIRGLQYPRGGGKKGMRHDLICDE